MTRVSSSNTKAQILDAYEKLLKDVENRTQENLKETQKRKEAVQKVEEITKTTEVDIIEQINQTKDIFVKALTDLSLSLSQERNKLAKIRPVPTAITLPRVDFSAALPVKTIPPADFVSTSSRFKITLSCNGRIFIDFTPKKEN